MSKVKKQKQAQQELPNMPAATGIVWRKLERPKDWKPSEAGDELLGYYLGKTLRDGKWGQYEVAMLSVPGTSNNQVWTVSGTQVIQAIEGGGAHKGALLRVVFGGWKDLEPKEEGEPRRMKLFECFVGEGVITPEQVRVYLESVGEVDDG